MATSPKRSATARSTANCGTSESLFKHSNKTGLYIAKYGDVEYDPAYQVLVLPHIEGETWKRPKQKSDGAKQNFTALASEVLKIDSISVDAIGVEHLTTISPLACMDENGTHPKLASSN